MYIERFRRGDVWAIRHRQLHKNFGGRRRVRASRRISAQSIFTHISVQTYSAKQKNLIIYLNISAENFTPIHGYRQSEDKVNTTAKK
jgi:hypothetical protein